MCGIVGYIGGKDATPIIINGLKRLEYRGYDSAGLAVLENDRIQVRRDAGKIHRLEELIRKQPLSGHIGIGHTRWATHGVPNAENAHPHMGNKGEVVVVHNGIVENYQELREALREQGALFHSETDTETIVHLVERYMDNGETTVSAALKALSHLKGAHGIVLFSSREPDKIIAARIGNAGGVVIGYGEDDMYIASDIPAILEYTHRMVFLDSGQMAVVKRGGVEIFTLKGIPVEVKVNTIIWDAISAEKGKFRHFMHKEIHEQVRSLMDTLAGRVDFENNEIRLPELHLPREKVKKIDKIVITACGTAAHAGMIGKILIERLAKIPSQVEIASEFRYSDPLIYENSIVLAISQSGETADTLAAMEEARRKGATIWSIVNAIGSQAMRLADGCISMQTGPEIGVASTKAFTAPLVDLYLLAVLLADKRGHLAPDVKRSLISDLRLIPNLVGNCLEREEEVVQVARALKDIRNILYLGRGINMPIAYEGALKLKEISYIHAEAYPAGEMKHGPIALVDKDLPVLAIAPADPWYDKMLSQIEQVKARGGVVIVIATDGDQHVQSIADHVLWIPKAPWLFNPVAAVIPLQLLAYHIASLKGLDVDQPRNLAKSVTVE